MNCSDGYIEIKIDSYAHYRVTYRTAEEDICKPRGRVLVAYERDSRISTHCHCTKFSVLKLFYVDSV